MSDSDPRKPSPENRYSLSALARPGALASLALIAAILGVVAAAFAWSAGWFSPHRVDQTHIVNAFEADGGVRAGFRRNHAKGVCFTGWFDGTYSGARTFFRHVHTIDIEKGYGDWNGSRSSDKDIDELLEKILQITNESEYAKALREANRMIMERVRVIPLHYEVDIYAVRKKSGIEFTPRPDQWIVLKEMVKQ